MGPRAPPDPAPPPRPAPRALGALPAPRAPPPPPPPAPAPGGAVAGGRARARSTGLPLIRRAPHKPSLWFAPPPAATAYFSRARSPGVVLRVSEMTVPDEPAARTNAFVSVAMPHRRPR